MVLRPEGVVGTYGFWHIENRSVFVIKVWGFSVGAKWIVFSSEPANLNVSCDRATNCKCWASLIVSKSFTGSQLSQLAGLLQFNQVIMCSCRILNRYLISVYVLLLAWISKLGSCSPSWLYVFVAVFSKLGCLSRSRLSHATETWRHRQYLWIFDIFLTFSKVSQSLRSRFGGFCVCKADSIFS